jgi:hypothetical protein
MTISLGIFHRPTMPEVETWFRDLESVLAGFRAEVADAGSKLLVVVFPVRIQVDARDWKLIERAYALREDAFDLEYPNRRIAANCAGEGIELLDLTAVFRERLEAGEGPLYRPRGDMHFNEAGQRLAAEAIGERILATTLR